MTVPAFTERDAEALVERVYGISGPARALDGERDRNFRIDADGGHVLKIAPAEDSRDILELQAEVLDFLASRDLSVECPRIRRTRTGESLPEVTHHGERHFARLVTFLPGSLYAQVEAPTSRLRESLGEALGELDRALEHFAHPAAGRSLPWDLSRARTMLALMDHVEPPEVALQVEQLLHRFCATVEPVLPDLRRSVIHNDANDYNVVVDADGSRVTGLIDFGDMLEAPTICELAIAAAYAMLGQEDPIAAAGDVIRGYHRRHPLTDSEFSILFDLITARLASSIAMSSRNQAEDPGNEYLQISGAPVRELVGRLHPLDPRDVEDAFRRACDLEPGSRALPASEIQSGRREHLSETLSVSYREPLHITGGSGPYLFSAEGRAYLDLVNNVCHVGHAHPHVVAAAHGQMARLNTNTRYLHETIVDYARQLTSTLPEPLRVCFFVCSGSEANDLALRLARTHTGGQHVIVLESAYHGNTTSLIEISPYKFDGPGGAGAPERVHVVPLPDRYRGEHGADDPDAGRKYAADVLAAVNEVAEGGGNLSAFFCESLAGVAGQIVLPEGYLAAAYPCVREAGGVCVADEVQVGFGRVGTHFWGFETQGVVPDIVTLGKPIGNGHPLAAVVTTPEIAESFQTGMEYFNTFGGNPVSCAVGRAVLEVIEREGLQAHALEVGTHLLGRLRDLQERHPRIGDVRGVGLFLGIELVTDRASRSPAAELASEVAEAMKERGFLLSVDGPLHNVLKIKPPLVVGRRQGDAMVDALESVLSSLGA